MNKIIVFAISLVLGWSAGAEDVDLTEPFEPDKHTLHLFYSDDLAGGVLKNAMVRGKTATVDARSAAEGGVPAPTGLNQAARQYLNLIENFAGFAEAYWNEKAQSYDARGTGVIWARGNGGVTLVNAVLLTELPDKATISPKRIPRGVLLDHTRRAIRRLCLTSRVCTDPRAVRPGTWGGRDPPMAGLARRRLAVATGLRPGRARSAASWAFSELGTLLDQSWARAAEARCLKLLVSRQAAFGDGSIHAFDFGYETDLAVVWTYSFLLHKFFGKGDSGPSFDEPRGSKIFPYVCVAVHRTPELVSSVTWFRSRQAVMVSPNHPKTMASRPAFTRYDETSGTGWIRLEGDSKRRSLEVEGKPRITQAGNNGDVLTVTFARVIKDKVRQRITCCALPKGAVAVFSRWLALDDMEVTKLVDHLFRWVQIEKFISPPDAKEISPGVWVVDGKLRMDILGCARGEPTRDGINGAARRDFSAKAGEILQKSVRVYQTLISGRAPLAVEGDADSVRVGDWILRCDGDTELSLGRSPR